jgi:hypothetical protein
MYVLILILTQPGGAAPAMMTAGAYATRTVCETVGARWDVPGTWSNGQVRAHACLNLGPQS